MSKLVLWLIFAILIAHGNTADLPTDQKLIVVMLDGCRWDYFTRNPGLTGFQKIKEGDVSQMRRQRVHDLPWDQVPLEDMWKIPRRVGIRDDPVPAL